MYWLDKITEKFSRQVANSTSRRHLLKRIGLALAGGAAVPLLPVARAADTGGGSGYHGVAPQTSGNPDADPGDPASCDYWRYLRRRRLPLQLLRRPPRFLSPGNQYEPHDLDRHLQEPGRRF